MPRSIQAMIIDANAEVCLFLKQRMAIQHCYWPRPDPVTTRHFGDSKEKNHFTRRITPSDASLSLSPTASSCFPLVGYTIWTYL